MTYYFPFDPRFVRTQDFGNIQNNAVIQGGRHGGDDYGTPVGTPVRAAGDGVIEYSQTFDSSYADNYAWNTDMAGLLVWLNCGPNAPSFEYGHLSRSLVVPGQHVKAGQIIAITGNSGGSTGPHCHVGCLPPGYDLNTDTYGRVNPRIYMTKYWIGGGIFMALSDEEQKRLLSAADRINGVINDPQAKVLTTKHLAEIGDAVLKKDFPWFGFNGSIPSAGRKVSNLETMAGWHDTGTAQLQSSVVVLTELVKQLSLATGVVIDYTAIAKAVNDDAAERLAK